MDAYYQRADSLFLEKCSLIRVWKFPVPLRREFGCKLLNVRVDQTRKSRWRAGFCKIPCSRERRGAINTRDVEVIEPERRGHLRRLGHHAAGLRAMNREGLVDTHRT